MVNPRKHQELAISITASILELLFDISLKIGNKIAREMVYKYIDDSDLGLGRDEISKALYDLNKSNCIASDGGSVVLTNKTKMKFVEKITADIPRSKKRNLVSFDIPEPMRRSRDSFRRFIKRIGFIPLQKSLWVNKKDLGELVELAAKEYGVSDYVAYFVSEKSNIDQYINRQFKKQKEVD
jgi:DNA-binding transcriptional regulator PaaX